MHGREGGVEREARSDVRLRRYTASVNVGHALLTSATCRHMLTPPAIAAATILQPCGEIARLQMLRQAFPMVANEGGTPEQLCQQDYRLSISL